MRKKLLMIGLLILTMGMGLVGCGVTVGKMNYKEYMEELDGYDFDYERQEITEKYDISLKANEDINNVEKINIKMNSGIVHIIELEGSKIEIIAIGKVGNTTTELKGSTLNIVDTTSMIKDFELENIADGRNIGTELYIAVPKGFNKDLNIELGAGLVSINESEFKDIKVDIGAGAVTNENIIKANSIDIKIGVGLVDTLIKEAEKIKVNMETGMVELYIEEGTGNIDIDNKVGAIEINYLNGNPKIEGEVTLGEMYVDNINSENKIDKIKAELNIGEINIEKMSKDKLEERLERYPEIGAKALFLQEKIKDRLEQVEF